MKEAGREKTEVLANQSTLRLNEFSIRNWVIMDT